MREYLPACVYTHRVHAVSVEVRGGLQITLELEPQALVSQCVGAGTEPSSSIGAASVLHHVPLAPKLFF